MVKTVRNVGATINQQVQQRPLTVLGVSIGVGAVLQPMLDSYAERVTEQVQETASSIAENVSQVQATVASALAPPNQEDMARIQHALVSAMLERAKKLANHDLHDVLDRGLEPIVAHASLRAGIVAAVTERTSDVVENRLPRLLTSTLTGTRTVVVAAILGAVLDAYSTAPQGEGKTTGIMRRTITETLTQQLQRSFPEFREHYQNREAHAV
jgi:hypothetical protein